MKKLLLGLGTMVSIAAPIAVVISCAPWDKPKTGDADLTGANMNVWHGMFNAGGFSSPPVGNVYSVTVGGKKITYTWTAADASSQIVSDFKGGTNNINQKEIIDYLATQFSVKNPGVTASDVKAAFGIPSDQHGIGTTV